MQRLFGRKKGQTSATDAAIEQDPPKTSLAAPSSSARKIFPSGIKLLHSPAVAVVECVHLYALPVGLYPYRLGLLTLPVSSLSTA